MTTGYGQLEREAAGDRSTAIPPMCSNCGYDLRGAVSRNCPECGHITTRQEIAQQTAQTKRAIADYTEALEWGRRGMKVGAVGLVAVGWGLLLPSGWLQPLLRMVSFLAGPIAFFLGLSVFRAQTQHPPIRDQLQTTASHTPSGLAVVFGIADCLSAIFGPW